MRAGLGDLQRRQSHADKPRMKTSTVLLGAALFLAACGADPASDVPATPAADLPTTTSIVPGTTSTLPNDGVGPIEGVDLATYVSAVEDVLAGTSYEGEALEAPEVFAATGVLFCERLTSGSTPDEIITEYVETLIDGPIEQAAEDDLVMAGGVLGVGVVTMCPQYLDTLVESS